MAVAGTHEYERQAKKALAGLVSILEKSNEDVRRERELKEIQGYSYPVRWNPVFRTLFVMEMYFICPAEGMAA